MKIVLSLLIVVVALLVVLSIPGPDGKPSRITMNVFSGVIKTLQTTLNTLKPPQARLMEQASAFFASQVIYTVTKLGVADVLRKTNRPTHVDEIAKALSIKNSQNLGRVLKAATRAGLFERDGDKFSNNAMSELLLSDSPDSFKNMVLHAGNHLYQPWGRLKEAIEQPNQAKVVFGKEFWEYLDSEKEESEIFDLAMRSGNALTNSPIATDYAWSQHDTVADIGGGIGSLLESILKYNPSTRGILFDRPASIQVAEDYWKKHEMKDRVTLVSGSFFDSVPVADAYVLRYILHDWNDDDCVRILKTIRESIGTRNATLVIADNLLDEPNWSWAAPEFMDLNMMVMLDANERTRDKMAEIFKRSGFELVETLLTRSPLYLSIGRPLPQ